MANRRSGYRKRSTAEIMARNCAGEKRCGTCGLWQPLSEFQTELRLSDGLSGRCKSCERFRRYHLTRKDVLLMLEEQNHECPICAKGFHSFNDFVVDHTQACCPIYGGRTTCGKCTRGLICQRCNANVLSTLENPQLMSKAFEYIGKYQ